MKKVMAQVAGGVDEGFEVSLDLESIMHNHDGPACLFDANRTPVAVNGQWCDLGLPDGRGFPDETSASNSAKSNDVPEIDSDLVVAPYLKLPGQLVLDIIAAQKSRTTGASLVQFPVNEGTAADPERSQAPKLVEFQLLPVLNQGQSNLLVLGRDRSYIDTLQKALKESREFHRAFAACSADFIWQVDTAGVIDYTGPRGLLDYDQDELFGQPIARFFSDLKEAEGNLTFLTREPTWEQEVWLSDRKGDSHCFLISSVPVADGNGNWIGVRGVGREVTEQRVREAELKRARYSQRMIDSVLYAMRSEVDPRAILDAATIVAADSARLDACLVARSGKQQKLEWISTTLPNETLKSSFDQFSDQIIDLMDDAILAGNRGLARHSNSHGSFLIAVTRVNGEANGAIAFARDKSSAQATSARPWSPADENILRAMSEQLGISLAQYELVETLRDQRSGDDVQR